MKKLLILLAIVLSIVACENQDLDFADFGITSVYFPFQTPIRTLILGNYDLGDNENDNNHRFEIGVTMAGIYTNDEDRKVHFKVAPELLSGVENVKALPASYYTIETESPVTIPVGSIKGRIKVQLTDQFFNDTLSFAGLNQAHYAIPLLITEIENLDTLLVGVPISSNPSRVNAEDWEITPKDYTLFGIKFMNKYQAIYLRRGVDKMTNAASETVSSTYHAKYVEQDELVTLTTIGKNNVELSNLVRRGSESSPGNVNIELVFSDEGNCTIRSFGDDGYNVSGSGKFVENGDMWGGKEHDVIYLDYTYTDAANNERHAVKDTLVVRDRNVVFEEFTIQLSE
ncbi:DUF5627 domain-containing protein [Draconibacterium mangrovi]|uniref:DUF5627 domain-containing protein n=1 Tax=Draconibacterium mangrovi TaxID=2697469 RepID=UPI0013D04204|nr:DUF5627 domain-containing protein [Draconibacterium mangrovi]